MKGDMEVEVLDAGFLRRQDNAHANGRKAVILAGAMEQNIATFAPNEARKNDVPGMTDETYGGV